MDIRIALQGVTPPKFVETLAEHLPFEWRRDGILEHQVSTQEDVQYAFRNEPGPDSERPRTGLVLAGPPETLTVATVVPVDRGIDLSDDMYAEIVEEFYDKVVAPAVASLDGAEAQLVESPE